MLQKNAYISDEFASKMLQQNTTVAPTPANASSAPSFDEGTTLESANTLTSSTQIEPMPRKETSSTAASKPTHSFNSSIVKGNHRAAVREEVLLFQ